MNKPVQNPRTAPPTVSWASMRPTPRRVIPPGAAAACRMVRNSTTPTPSFSSDSDETTVSIALPAPAWRVTATTATGSVGEISAPNSRQPSHGSGIPIRPSPQCESPATMNIDAAVPNVARTVVIFHCRRSSSRSTVNAPAKSKKPSIQVSRASPNWMR